MATVTTAPGLPGHAARGIPTGAAMTAVLDTTTATPPDGPVPGAPSAPPQAVPLPPQLRFGSFGLGSAALYLLVWSVVLFVVSSTVLVAGYLALERLGVLLSLSRSAATVLSQPLPESGLLPALEPAALLPYALVGSAALALLWLVASLAFVCVHNAVSTLTGGLRVKVREPRAAG